MENAIAQIPLWFSMKMANVYVHRALTLSVEYAYSPMYARQVLIYSMIHVFPVHRHVQTVLQQLTAPFVLTQELL